MVYEKNVSCGGSVKGYHYNGNGDDRTVKVH